MKPIFKKSLNTTLTCLGLLLFLIVSCKKSDEGVKSPPSITRIRTISKQDSVTVVYQANLYDPATTYKQLQSIALDSTVTAGNVSGMYAIVGQNLLTTNSITINGVPAVINPALNSDKAVFFTIATTTPYIEQEGKLIVKTKYGSASFDFSVLQPPPLITDVSQLAGSPGDVITITGTTMDAATSVKFGTAEAQIQANTSTQILVKVPANALGPISVTTAGGTSMGPSVSYDGKTKANIVPFGFSSIFFDDAIIQDGYDFSFNGVELDKQNTDVVKRGKYAVKVKYTGSYAGYAIGSGNPVAVTNKNYIKFSIYGDTGTEGRVIKVGVNDFETHIVSVLLHEKKWSTYAIPISAFQATAPGTLTSVNWIGFQDLSGNPPTTMYLDDVGVF